MRTRTIAVVVVLSLALVVPGPASAGPAAYQPDSMVKSGFVSYDPMHYTGFGVYSSDGTGQQVTKTVKPGKTVKYWFVAFNGGTDTDDLDLQGCASTSRVKVKWTYNAETVTGELVGGMTLTDVDGSFGQVFGLEVSLKKGVKRASITCAFDVTSQAVPSLTDRSKSKTTFRA